MVYNTLHNFDRCDIARSLHVREYSREGKAAVAQVIKSVTTEGGSIQYSQEITGGHIVGPINQAHTTTLHFFKKSIDSSEVHISSIFWADE
jgi:hypothetical protein